MPRCRKVPAVNVQEQKQIILQRKNKVLLPSGPFFPVIRTRPPVSRTNISPKDYLLGICTNLRGVCKNVRNFATEMDNLLNSLENILPVVDTVVAGYTRSASLPKQNVNVTAKEEDIPEVKDSPPVENTSIKEDTAKTLDTSKVNETKSAGTTPPSFPSEEEIKAFLSNPLVISLMQTLTQKLKPQQ